MTLIPGDKTFAFPDGKGGYYFLKSSPVIAGDKGVMVNGTNFVKSVAPLPGDKTLALPDNRGEYHIMKSGVNFKGGMFTALSKQYDTYNGGLTWGDAKTIPNANYYFLDGVYCDDDVMLVSGRGSGSDYWLWRSTNLGESWAVASGFFRYHLCYLGDSIVIASNDKVAGIAMNFNIFKSTNKGVSFVTEYSEYLPTGGSISVYEIIDNGAGQVWVTTTAGIYFSGDYGDNWSKISTTAFTNIAYLEENILMATSGGTVYITTNNGVDWASLGESSEGVMASPRPGYCLVVGSNVRVTRDYGVNWETLFTLTYPVSAEYSPEYNCVVVYSYQKMYVVDSKLRSYQEVTPAVPLTGPPYDLHQKFVFYDDKA